MPGRSVEFQDLGNDQLMEQIMRLAQEYRKRFGRPLGITAEVGEYLTCRVLNLNREQSHIQQGYDAKDKAGRKVQIKARIYNKGSRQRTGRFQNFDFDYAVLTLLDTDFEPKEIYKVEQDKVKATIKQQSYKYPSLTISKFKQIGKRIWP